MPETPRGTDKKVPVCEKCDWQHVAVFIKNQCVMLSRCKKCGEFGRAYGLVPEPFFNSAEIQLNELPPDFRQYLETVIEKIKDYPAYYLD